jgi:hypothetical protein
LGGRQTLHEGVPGLVALGGTILGTTNKGDLFA